MNKRIKIKVEGCWGGGDRYYFRMTDPEGRRETVTGMDWTSRLARQARHMYANVYGYNPKLIRFEVR